MPRVFSEDFVLNAIETFKSMVQQYQIVFYEMAKASPQQRVNWSPSTCGGLFTRLLRVEAFSSFTSALFFWEDCAETRNEATTTGCIADYLRYSAQLFSIYTEKDMCLLFFH